MAEFKLDRFKYNWKGEWATSTGYKRDDVVGYGGSSFVCTVAHTASGLFSSDLNNLDQVNNVSAPRWIKMTDGYAWRDQWEVSTVYDAGDIVAYGGNLYICIESHVSEPTFEDNNEKWAIYSSQISLRNEWQTFVRYGLNDVVRYNGIVYRCTIEHTSSTSLTIDQEKWTVFYEGIEYQGTWSIGAPYRLNDIVKYKGSLYRSIRENSAVEFSSENWILVAPGFRFKNEWNEETVYGIGDIVRLGGWLFYSLTNNLNSNPVNSIYQSNEIIDWEIISKGIKFRGEWNTSEEYKTGDLVRRGGLLYIALLDTALTADGSSLDYLDDSNWELVAKGQNFKSAWQENQRYAVGDVVVFFGSAFICKLEHESSNLNFPSLDIPEAGTGFVFWDMLSEAASPAGMQSRGDLLTYNLTKDFYGDDSSFGLTRVPVGDKGKLLTINNNDSVIYKNYGEINRVFYVAENGIDDNTDSQRGVSPFKPYRTVRFACEQADDNFEGTTTVRVRTGRYEEILPIIVPARTAVVGDELRSTTIAAAGPIASLALDSTYTVAVLTRIFQIIDNILTGDNNGSIKIQSNPLDPVFEIDGEILEIDLGSIVSIRQLILDIQNYINFFINSASVNPVLVGTNTATDNQGYINAVRILQANKEFLAEDAVAYMKETFPEYDFVEDLCKRDVRRYVDAWAYDLIFTGNYKSLLSARYYRNAVLGSKLEDMFYVRDATGVRNLTVAGLEGQLNPPNVNDIFRLPTGGSYVSLDPGWGPDDDRTWIINRSPYIQNVTTLGRGSIGQKIDGALHNGGNRSIVSNDFTQVIDEGIGAWVLNSGRAELVSVFTYYAHVGYLATNGGIIRGTNGNNSYGKFGCIAEGNNDEEIPQSAVVNNRNQQASATVLAGDFTDEIQIIEWNNAGQDYTQAAASFVGAGAGVDVKFEDFRDDAVYTVSVLDSSDSLIQRIGGGGYIRVQNNAQIHQTPNGDLTSITIAANDPNSIDEYLGCRIIITSGPGTGQYGYITGYNTGTKVVTVSRESDDQPGWDHLIQGTLPATTFTTSTSYRIEPRSIFSEPPYRATEFITSLSTDWGSLVYGETTENYSQLQGQLGTGDVEEQDGLTAFPASFNVSKVGRTYVVSLVNGGAGYRIGDEIVILGTELGGLTPYNDLLIKVRTVSNDSTNSIITFTSTGIGASGKFVAITKDGTAGIYSSDGENWSNSFNMPSAGDWTCLAAGDNKFVAIRTNSSVFASSLDGVNWTAGSMPSNRSWTSVVYGNDRFVAIASDQVQGTVAYTVPGSGITWAQSTIPAGGDSSQDQWVDLAYGKNKFVAIANSQNAVAFSDDGITWTSEVIDNNTPKDWVSIAYGNNRFVAVASTGEVVYSFINGSPVVWLNSTLPTVGSVKWSKIRYAQGVFFALAESENDSPTSVAATSPDGVIWTVRTLDSTEIWNDVAFGNPYIEELDSSIGKSTPMWIVLSNTNVTNNIRTGARALGRVEITAGVVSNVKIWDTGSGYDNKPSLTLVSPTATSNAIFSCRLADGVLSNPSWLNRGIGYRTGTTRVTITGNGLADVIPVGKFVTLENLSRIPGPGSQIFFNGNPTRYTIVTIEQLENNNNGLKAFLRISPELRIRDNLQHATGVTIREEYSQIRITGHDFLDIGTGNFIETNYPELYSGLFFSAPEDEVREENGGRVFYTSTDQGGNFRTGELFAVEQATGIVTISADFFDLSGLEELKLGGIRVGGSGAVIREFSTDPTFTEDSNNIVPTQRAIRAFLQNRLSLGGSEIATFEVRAGQIILGGPDSISNAVGLKIVVPVVADFSVGISGSMLAQNMFYRSFN